MSDGLFIVSMSLSYVALLVESKASHRSAVTFPSSV